MASATPTQACHRQLPGARGQTAWQHMSAGRRTGSLHLSFLTTTPPFITHLACSNFDPLNLSLLHNRLHLIEGHVCGTGVHNHLERDRHKQGGMRVVFPWERRGEDAAPACGILKAVWPLGARRSGGACH